MEESKVESVIKSEMWLVNVVLHVFEHLAKRSKYCEYVTCFWCSHLPPKRQPHFPYSPALTPYKAIQIMAHPQLNPFL